MVTRTRTVTGTDSVTPGSAPIIGGDTRNSDGPGPEIMSAETLIGDSVVNAVGDDLGDIKAIMLDVTSGRIGYAVLWYFEDRQLAAPASTPPPPPAGGA